MCAPLASSLKKCVQRHTNMTSNEGEGGGETEWERGMWRERRRQCVNERGGGKVRAREEEKKRFREKERRREKEREGEKERARVKERNGEKERAKEKE